MQFRLPGRLEVEADGVDLTPARPKQRALLALLLLRAGRVVAVDEKTEASLYERLGRRAEFDEVAAELGRTLDFFKVPER